MSANQQNDTADIYRIRDVSLLVVVNLSIVVAFLILSEVTARVVKTGASCLESCSFQYISNPPKIYSPRMSRHGMEVYKFDPLLGYVPKPGFKMTFGEAPYPKWSGKTVTILHNGMRANNNSDISISNAEPILTAGDSFTFGQDVSDNETWPACLERRLGRLVHNGGVSGYGAAQALRRLEALLSNNADYSYGAIIFSVLVGDDFRRDKLNYVWGRPSPVIVGSTVDTLKYDSIVDPAKFGSIFDAGPPTWLGETIVWLANKSWLIRTAAHRTVYFANYLRQRVEKHPNPAPKDLIIEWTLERFSKLKLPSILVLQYWRTPDREALSERAKILRMASKYGIKIVDTYQVFRRGNNNVRELYEFYHHNLRGNLRVCELIQSALLKEMQSRKR